ncbi:MAG: hypothetical protein AAGI07_17535 [Bacteroidota bacterium]
MNIPFSMFICCILFWLASCKEQPNKAEKSKPVLQVEIASTNPNYFSVNHKPALLLGGSHNDNIFQDHPLEPQLDSIKKFGGNYIRCTLSSRDFANQWPFKQRPDALYDLNEFSGEYWSRLEKFLMLTQKKGIIVQLEIWDHLDFYKIAKSWAKHPFNPAYNINYTAIESNLPEEIDYFPQEKTQPFFKTVPVLEDNQIVLTYQQKFVDKLLSHTLQYDHILYCINNANTANFEWSIYWAKYIKAQASKQDKSILVTDMLKDMNQLPVDLVQYLNNQFKPFIKHYQIFDFVDISLNDILRGETHFKSINGFKALLNTKNLKSPLTSIKIFGGEQDDGNGNIEDGTERFWRNAFAGLAAVRFHRPPSGLGVNRLAQVNMLSLRMLSDSLDFFNLYPANHLLSQRKANEAFCLANPDKEYAIYYPGCGEVVLNTGNYRGALKIKWLNILKAHWEEQYSEDISGQLVLRSPCEGKWAVWIRKEK